ncbi:MAG: hypothetical protein AB7S26_24995 [Sandaracinaceae bacterium]
MDLSMLEHLSDEALRAEAARRQITDADAMDRAALIEAIRRSAVSLPPNPTSVAAPAEEPKRGTLGGTARAMFGQLVGLAKGALQKRGSSPPPPPSADEPIRTRTMAELLIEQGETERGLSILQELEKDRPHDSDLRARTAEIEGQVRAQRAERRAKARLAAGGGPFVELFAEAATRAVAWTVDDHGLERARAVLGEAGTLTLRSVVVAAHKDRSVETRRTDRPVSVKGAITLGAQADARWVVSVGLAAGERFASIAHVADPL